MGLPDAFIRFEGSGAMFTVLLEGRISNKQHLGPHATSYARDPVEAESDAEIVRHDGYKLLACAGVVKIADDGGIHKTTAHCVHCQ